MATIATVAPGFYRIPLPAILTDSMHGVMRDFELVTARVRDADGAEGVGYTFTVGRNGGAIHDVLSRDIAGIVRGEDADRIEHLWNRLGGNSITAAAAARPCWPSPPSTWRSGT